MKKLIVRPVPSMTTSRAFSRRRAVNMLLTGFAAPLGGNLVGCGSSPPGGDPGPSDAAAHDAGNGDSNGSCALTLGQEEGPFYIDEGWARMDIRDGMIGVPLALTILIIDAATCLPLAGAAIDLWHAGPRGAYSTLGQLFLRGVVGTSLSGKATFTTLYPGWYPGRTPHVHVKVRLGGIYNGPRYESMGSRVAHVGQLFFPADTNDLMRVQYKSNTNTYINNNADAVYTGQGGASSQVALSGDVTAGFAGAVTLVVKRS
jgi:protocatechuate 3,4-dioxygenase beta subunit